MLHLGKELFQIHSIDLKEERCEKCGKHTYPSIFSSALGYWKYSYICNECIIRTNYITKQELEHVRDCYLKSLGKEVIVDSTWVYNEDKKKVLDYFLKLEEEDKEIIKDIDLYKAHVFVEGLKKGDILFSEQEMYDYFNFYGNNMELVYGLRELAFEDKRSKFLLDMYKSARKMRLTDRQIHALKKSRKFKKLCEDVDDFWESLPLIINYLGIKEELDDWDLKVKDIVTFVMDNDFYTDKQRYVIDKYISERVLVDGS